MSMLRRGAVLLVWSLIGLFVAGAALEGSGLGRPGGGQNYRAPSRPSAPSRSYTPSTPSRSSSSYSTTPSRSTTYNNYPSRGSTVIVGSDGGSYSSSGPSAGTIIVILLIAALVIWIIYVNNRKKAPERATLDVDRGLQKAGLDALKQQDPGFDPAAFVTRTKAVVTKVNEAWLAGNMGPARRAISDGVYVRFQTQLALLKADGLRNVMTDWRVVSADILAAVSDPLWDTVHVKIVGEARDKDVALSLTADQAKREVGKQELSQYHEVWSFVRRRGKKSKSGVPALEGKCPSCGADLPLSEVVKCEYCQALVNSGEHDWVLAEITQPEEWREEPAVFDIQGLAEARQHDPTLSRQELEDRASVVFWKWIEARTTGKSDKIVRFSLKNPKDPEAALELGLAPARLRQVAVGSAELDEVSSDGTLDHALVEIRWSASIDGSEPRSLAHMFELVRSVEARSKRGLSSLDCPVCSGQLANSDDPKCQYCGATLNGGKHEWALASVETWDDGAPDEPDGE